MRALLVFSVLLLAGLSVGENADCKNGGTPIDSKTCSCTSQFKGDLCEQVNFCSNGGVLNEDKTCDCQPYWTGDACEKVQCVNGGYKTNDNFCHCPKGYYGIHCDAVKQSHPVDGVFNTKKSFNLYIHNELTDWYGMKALQRIKNKTEEILGDYKYDQFNLFVSKREKDLISGESAWDPQQFLTKKEFIDYLTDHVDEKRTRTYTCLPTDISYKKLLDELRKKEIEDGVILMFTQYPPNVGQDEDLLELKKYLRAFRIKLNVLIGADDILLDCNSKKNKDCPKFAELTDLVHFTDGEIASFLIEDDDSPDELLPSFIRSSASPQSHYRAASLSCSSPPDGLSFEFQTDPYPNTYYIAVRSDQDDPAVITGSCSSGGEVVQVAFSEYKEFSLFSILSGAQQTCVLHVKTSGGCLTTVYSVGGEKGVDKFDIFHSFATSDDMDTDSIHSFKNEEYFLTMHIDIFSTDSEPAIYQIVEFGGEVLVKNDQEEQELYTWNLTKRRSTFEYQSQFNFECPDVGISWIQLNLEGFNVDGKSVSVLNRIIHLNCEARKEPADPSPKQLRMMAATKDPKPTLALMYSNFLPTSQFSRFILEGVNDDVVKDKFSKYGYIRFDGKESREFDPTPDFNQFKKDVYDYAPDKDVPFQENLNQNIQKLTANSNKVTSESLVSIAIDRSMRGVSAQYPSNLAELVNLGSRLLFWGDVTTVTVDKDELESLEEYIRIAGSSAGHVVLMDMDDFSDDPDETGDYPFYVSTALRDLYSFGPSQRLLSYSNLEWTQTSSQTSQSSPIGTLQIPEGADNIFLSLTLNVENPSDVSPAFMLSIVLEGAHDRIVLNIDDFKQYGTPGYVRSNLYTANVPAMGGELYQGTFTLLAMTPFTGAHIRFWIERGDEEIPELNYVDFDMKKIQPNDFLGAALRVEGDEGETISLRFLDQNGEDAQRLDHNQTVPVEDGVAHFIPYFCNSNQSVSLSKDMYTVVITYEATNYTYFRPMLCTASGKPNVKDCDVTDEDGNVFCENSNPPFNRGPSGELIDCSGVGQVYYANGGYYCNCLPGFSGPSCESSQCSSDITHLPGERDASYRTLTFVFISPAGDEESGCTNIFFYYADDIKQLFKGTYDNIWQFTFLVYFNDGNVKTMYRGPRLTDFLKVLDDFKKSSFDPDTFCGVNVDQNQKPLDIADVYSNAVESVGRNSRGIVFLYASQSFLDVRPENQLDKLIVSEDFYKTVQAYQQHIYMVAPEITDDMVALTTASGGIAIKMVDDYALNFEDSKALRVFDEIINGEIGWIGVVTEKSDRTWIVNDEDTVKLFVTSNATLPLTDCNNAIPTGDDNKFPFDTDDKTPTTSTVYSIKGPAKICLKFDAATDIALLQVVALTTKTTIQYALIGQGQGGEVDKHTAGATTNSTKGVHISFDQSDKEVEIKPKDTNWREAAREKCTFAQEFTPFNHPFEASGPFVVDFNMYKKDATDGSVASDPYSSLSVPLVVTETINCINGGIFEKGSYCKCSDDWSGPTCSQPNCQNGGTLNSHGDHCDCTETQFGGRFCKEEKKKSFFEEE